MIRFHAPPLRICSGMLLPALLTAGCVAVDPQRVAQCPAATVSVANLPTVGRSDRVRFEPSGIAVVPVGASTQAFLISDREKGLAILYEAKKRGSVTAKAFFSSLGM